MDRMACVNLPAFPLQLLIQRHPEWKNHAAVIVDKDKPQGTILWVNKHASRHSILPGMRYAKGLSLAPDLRAGEVSDAEIQKHIANLTKRLRFFTPDVEPSKKEPGVFWLNASGLSMLYPSLKKWAGLIGTELSSAGYYWSVALGFSRYGTYSTAKASSKIVVFDTLKNEREFVRKLPIVRMAFPPELRDALSQLAITTLGGFIDLPKDGIRKRFGNDAYDLYTLARNELFSPVDADIPADPFLRHVMFDHPETNVERLMFRIEKLLGDILVMLDKRGRLLSRVSLSLKLDNGDEQHEVLQPAAPTLDAAQILKLIDLRLHQISLKSGVVDLTVEANDILVHQKQLELFHKKPKRNLVDAEQAFAKLRAELGNGAVMRARLRDGHLPEACYEWEPMEKLSAPAPRTVKARNLVRRIFDKSIAFISWARRQGDGRQFLGTVKQTLSPPTHSPLRVIPGGPTDLHRLATRDEDITGPYIVSGGWWMRRVHREYYFVRSNQGRWFWIYYDKRRKQSFVQGAIE